MKRRQVIEEPEYETDDESDDEFDESDDDEEDDEYTDMASLLSNLLATDDDNVCTAMLKISTQLETTNKLLIKLVSHVTKPPGQVAPPTQEQE
jgi:hypothetical protein